MFADDGGGGGFMSQPANTQGGEDKKKGGRGQQSLLPVTIKMAKTARFDAGSEDRWTIEGRETTMVRVVANVMRRETLDTRLVLQIEDGTGAMEATIWTSAQDEELPTVTERRAKCVAGAYVVFHGALKEFAGKTTLRVLDARPVEDFNEVTNHFLEVIYSYALHQKRLREPAAPQNDAQAGNFFAGHANNAGSGGAPMDVDGKDDLNAVGTDGMTGMQRQILKYYTEYGTGDEGIHISVALDGLKDRFSETQVRDSIDALLAEGFLYSTLDEDHHKSTE